MKKVLFFAALLAALSCGCKQTDPVLPEYSVTVPSFATGADVSWLSEMEKDGKTFTKKDGTKADCFEVLKDCGVNAIRLRVWVNPSGGWSGKEDMAGLAVRATQAGLPVMVDFHYSDFFCDPGTQNCPQEWKADLSDVAKMSEHVADYTTEVLTYLKGKGVSPAWIQIGNETRNGMLWPLGKLWGDGAGGWDNFARLYRNGYNAAKAVFPNALVMPHLPNAYQDNAWWFTELKNNGCQFDMIALSHYPQSESKMTPAEYNAEAVKQIKALHSTFKVPVMVSEVGVKTPDNEAVAASVLKDFMQAIRAVDGCSGAFYWEPEVYGWWKPAVYNSLGWGAYGMGAFLTGGKPSSVMDALCK